MKKQKSVKYKASIILGISIISILGVLLSRAYLSSSYGNNRTFNYGNLKVKIVDEGGVSSEVLIRLYRSIPPSYANYLKMSTTWDCFIDTDETNITYINNHNIQLNQTTVSTQKDQNGDYNIINLSLSFDQHTGYQYKDYVTDSFQFMSFDSYLEDGTSGESTISVGTVQENTRRTVNLMTTGTNCGICTYDLTRYYDGTIELRYEKETYTISYNGNGGSGNMEKQIANPEEKIAVLKNTYARDGYIFYGWSMGEHEKEIILNEDDEICFSDDADKVCGLNEIALEQIRNTNELTLYAIWKPEKKPRFSCDVEKDEDMFFNCEKLEGGAGSKYSNDNTGSEMAHVDKEENEGYFTERYP